MSPASKVSLITTVKNASRYVGAWLDSVASQTRPPDEVIVVDGGSTDGTLEVLRAAQSITLIEEPGANIARGRNVAIQAAVHDVIALTDADCVLEPTWLAQLLTRMDAGADVAMGFYRPVAETFWQTCSAAVSLPRPGEIREDRFMPSGRSVAFRRDAIETVGGFPEWLTIGEDMYVDQEWRRLGMRMDLAADAVVGWRVRSGVGATWRQYFEYARGDAIARMHPRRHLVRFVTYTGTLSALSSSRRWPRLLAVAAGTAYATRPIRRARGMLETPRLRAAACVVVPAMMAFSDAAKMAGYLAGLLDSYS